MFIYEITVVSVVVSSVFAGPIFCGKEDSSCCAVLFVPSIDNPFQPSIGPNLHLLAIIDCSPVSVHLGCGFLVSRRMKSNDRFMECFTKAFG